ncbi:HTH_48 domain-containing protein [Trichonephila clavipes]|uniref:HTH_48 domain-containing protein n=1 Tax=Trichonephila clavipes TaxID=2585209 RepID=A0A8X6VIB2_TRICX|nr:HTH_48 domain-containing protein [Trichonephila clavipes]
MSAADIHRQIIEVYGTEAMNVSKVRKWVRKTKDGQTNVHDEERSGRPSVITDYLMQAVKTKIRENGRFTITTLSLEFPIVSWSVVYKIETEDLNIKKLCPRNNNQLRCLLRNSTAAPKSIAKQTAWQDLPKGVFLLHDNPRSRTAGELIESFDLEILDHAPYSPDLAPSDFRLFLFFKHSLGGKHFSDSEEVKPTVNSWLFDQAVDFFEEGFKT